VPGTWGSQPCLVPMFFESKQKAKEITKQKQKYMDCIQNEDDNEYFYDCIPVDVCIPVDAFIYTMPEDCYLDLNEPAEPIQTCIPHVRSPATILAAKFIQNHKSPCPLRVLLDSGSTDNQISSSALPPGVVPRLNRNSKPGITLASTIDTQREVDPY